VQVLHAAHIIRRKPAPLPGDSICLVSALQVTAQERVDHEFSIVAIPLELGNDFPLNRLFPKTQPIQKCVGVEFHPLMLDVGERCTFEIPNLVQRNLEYGRHFLPLKCPGLQKLCILWRNANLLILHAFFQDGDSMSLVQTFVNFIPLFAQTLNLLFVSQFSRMPENPTRLSARPKKPRSVFLHRQAHANAFPEKLNNGFSDETITTRTDQMKHLLRSKWDFALVWHRNPVPYAPGRFVTIHPDAIRRKRPQRHRVTVRSVFYLCIRIPPC